MVPKNLDNAKESVNKLSIDEFQGFLLHVRIIARWKPNLKLLTEYHTGKFNMYNRTLVSTLKKVRREKMFISESTDVKQRIDKLEFAIS